MLTVRSDALEDTGRIPREHYGARGGGENRSLPVEWSDPPEGTRSFALALVDESPVARGFIHWLAVDIPAEVRFLPPAASGTSAMPKGARELKGTSGSAGYYGPTPPAGTGDHPYVLTLYALSVSTLPLPDAPAFADFERVVAPVTLGRASITGLAAH